MLNVEMGVYLGSADVAVAQEHLHDPQICSTFQEMRCKGMAEHVGRDFALNAC